jgi:hypothetical protein
MSEVPPVGEFAATFVKFMEGMTEAADRPEPPLLERLREHLRVEPAELPVISANFGIADRPNLQLALDAVVSERETIGLFSVNDLLDERARLTRRLLGQPTNGEAFETPPRESMLRAFAASGLPMLAH